MSKKILLVDDSSMSRKMIKRQIPESLQAAVHECENGKEALDYLRTHMVDLLILDLTMPEVDGYQVLESMQQENLTCLTIVVSADIQAEAEIRVKELGARDFLSKPMNKDRFLEILKEHDLV